MTLDEFIERLEFIKWECGGDTKVRGVFQPGYPLLAEVIAVTTIMSPDTNEVFIGLGEGRAYGSTLHYEDDLVEPDEKDEED